MGPLRKSVSQGVIIIYKMSKNPSISIIGYTNHSVVYPTEYDIKREKLWSLKASKTSIMRRELTRQTIKLRLLALVLALALLWYSLNPVPATPIRRKRDDELPDEKKRNLEPQSMPVTLPVGFRPILDIAAPLASSDEDDFEWPEFIDG